MKKGEVVVSHQHNFGHATFCMMGGILVDALDVQELNAEGNPVSATVIESIELWAGENYKGQNWAYIPKGRFHRITALAENTMYQCVYPHRVPEAFSMWPAGQRPQKDLYKRDEEGALWVRIDEKVTEVATGWKHAYG
jgi:quercetin dioxygenase-like cupin family protein